MKNAADGNRHIDVYPLEQVLEDQSGETSAQLNYTVEVENLDKHESNSKPNAFFSKEHGRRQHLKQFDSTSGDETPKEGPSNYPSNSGYDKNYMNDKLYSARRKGDRDDDKDAFTSDNRSQSDEDHHSIPSQKNQVVAPGPHIQ